MEAPRRPLQLEPSLLKGPGSFHVSLGEGIPRKQLKPAFPERALWRPLELRSWRSTIIGREHGQSPSYAYRLRKYMRIMMLA